MTTTKTSCFHSASHTVLVRFPTVWWWWTEYKWGEEQTGFIPICMSISTPRLCRARVTTGSGGFCFPPHFHAPASRPSRASKHGEEVLLCPCATRASLWMGNHGDELWPAWVLNRSWCVQPYVRRSLVPPFRVYEEKLCVLHHKHVHLFARCVALSWKAAFPYCLTAFWGCRRTIAYLFPSERCFNERSNFVGVVWPQEKLISGYHSQHVTLAQTSALWRAVLWKHWPPFFFLIIILFPAVAAPAGCSVA